MNKYLTLILLLSLAVLSTTSCSNPKKTLGLTRTAPDEFTVVSQEPLVLPPDFALTPLNQAEAKIRDDEASKKAMTALFTASETVIDDEIINTNADDTTITDKGALLLLAKAGATAPDENIRETITKEGSLLIEEDKTFTDKLVFWDREEDDPTSTIVDAQKEKQRIQENLALGKPVNEGETPSITRKKKTFLEFN